jgi:hypothetical protein
VLYNSITKAWNRHIHWIEPVNVHAQGFQSGPVPGTFTRLRSCIVPTEITEPPKISGGQNHKYDRLVEYNPVYVSVPSFRNTLMQQYW